MNVKNDFTTKESIIKATKKVLTEKGNVTIKDIAEAAFVNIAAINYHFGSKDHLIQIVVTQMVGELRSKIASAISDRPTEKSFDELMLELINIIFNFAEKNMGVVTYSFLQLATESVTSNVLIEFFLDDEEFIGLIMTNLKTIFPNATYETLYAKYLVIFSSFVVPFFLNFSTHTRDHNGLIEQNVTNGFKRFKDAYILELRRFLTP